MECYNFKKITYTDGIFTQGIDATYVLHLEGNGRIDYIEKELEKYHITNTVYIVFNKGFKKCTKSLTKQNSMYDIVDANVNIFQHANEHNYSNILILEDDFIFTEKIKDIKHIEQIQKFLVKNTNYDFMFHLGAIPFVSIPYDYYNNITFASGTHACVFSYSFRVRIIENQRAIHDWDQYHNKINFYMLNRYAYYTPLCYQLFPETENMKNWGVSPYIINTLIQVTALDKQAEPSTSYIYLFSKMILFIVLMIIVSVVYYFIRRPSKNISWYTYISRLYRKIFK